MDILGYSIDTTYPSFPPTGQTIINTINPHCYCLAKKDPLYYEALLQSNILIPDGIGIVLAARLLHNQSISRIAGSDIHLHLLNEAQKIKLKVFYLGATEEVLKIITKRVSLEYSSVRVGSYSPPFGQVFSVQQNQKMLDLVNQFEPDILFVGMGAPKQEKWVFQNKHMLNIPIICSIGAVFDFYAGTVKRSGKFWISSGLEWLPRLLKEPLRLWKRTLISTPLFVFYVIQEKIRLLKHRNERNREK